MRILILTLLLALPAAALCWYLHQHPSLLLGALSLYGALVWEGSR